jgi:hypothetical protein
VPSEQSSGLLAAAATAAMHAVTLDALLAETHRPSSGAAAGDETPRQPVRLAA